MLRPQLQEPRATCEERLGKVDCPPAGLRGDIGIDNGLKGREVRQCRPVSANSLGFGANRSMNPVLRRPARKSASLRIFRCSGTEVLMPSMTVISSVRRIRAIASWPVAAVHDDLGDHRVVVRRNGAVRVREGVDADARTARNAECVDDAWRRGERLGILGVDAAFDGMTGERHVALLERQPLDPRRCGSAP